MKQELYLIPVEDYRKELGGDTVLQYDILTLIASVQGLVNRDTPELFLLWQEADTFWLRYMREDGKFLSGRETVLLPSLSDFFAVYGDFIRRQGLILWDESVPATLNAAVTACGIDGCLPVRGITAGDTALNRILALTGAGIRTDLRGKFTGDGIIWETERPSTGSRKCDAYIWAMEKYLSLTNDRILFYTLDGASWADDRMVYPDPGNAFVFNRDYAVSKKAFVFDLSSYDDEVPCDDPGQPMGTDFAVMKEILRRHYEKRKGITATVCGFNPWQCKYTDFKNRGKHGPVEAEWHLTEVLSACSCVKDADAFGYCGLANASVYTHYPLKEKYQNRKPKGTPAEFDPEKTYILFYVGDYDAAAWTARHIPLWYRDPALGKNPLMWCFNPNLSDRIPMAFDFIYEHFTENDYFAAGDSGAGYNNPALLYEPRPYFGFPDGSAENIRHNRHYFEKFDLDTVGFVINGNHFTAEEQLRDIAAFAPAGGGYNNGPGETQIVNGAVFMPHSYDIAVEHTKTPEESAAAAFAGMARFPETKRFHIFRTILTSPTQHDEILSAMKKARPEANFELTDPHTFFRLAKYAKERGLTY